MLEWVTAGVGLILLLAVIGVILADALGGRQEAPPAITVARLASTPSAGGWVVEFEARNAGQQAAAEVQVVGVLTTGQGEPERRSATVDYLPGGGAARGGLLFRNDPAGGVLELTAEGYRQP
jgi:uncharacterized protein (TIGR02588 family)